MSDPVTKPFSKVKHNTDEVDLNPDFPGEGHSELTGNNLALKLFIFAWRNNKSNLPMQQNVKGES